MFKFLLPISTSEPRLKGLNFYDYIRIMQVNIKTNSYRTNSTKLFLFVHRLRKSKNKCIDKKKRQIHTVYFSIRRKIKKITWYTTSTGELNAPFAPSEFVPDN